MSVIAGFSVTVLEFSKVEEMLVTMESLVLSELLSYVLETRIKNGDKRSST